MKAFLNGVTLSSKDKTSIDLSSKEKNSLMLDLLTYPIIRSDMLERIRTGRLAADGYITSGPYVFVEKDSNTQYGYDRITIARNTKNDGEGWLDKYHFLFFPDITALERSSDTVSVIIPPVKNEHIPIGPRFSPYNYSFYEFIGLFQNTDRISNDVRKYLSLAFGSSFSGQVVEYERPVRSIFPDTITVPPLKLTKDLSDIMREKGYMKPIERISLLEKTPIVLTGSSVDYGKNSYFISPTKQKILFTEVADGSLLLTGNVPVGTKSVSISGYGLKEFLPGNTSFSYRVSLENQTLIEGKNLYTLETENASGKKETKEALTVYYSRDGLKLKTMKEQVEQEYVAKLNTPELVAERQKIIVEKKTKLSALDPRYYYNDSLKAYELGIVHAGEPASLTLYAKHVETTLTNLGIKSSITPLSTKDLQTMLQKGKKDYDIILVGFEATGRISRVGQVFLSSEAKNGINFAKVESKQLDTLFATLRTATEKSVTEDTERKILEYFQEGAFFTPISSPIHTLYIDRNLKGILPIDTFQDITTLHTSLAKASIKESYSLKTEGKGVFPFFGWIGNQIKNIGTPR